MVAIIHLNQEEIKAQLREMIKNSVEETLNAMLDLYYGNISLASAT